MGFYATFWTKRARAGIVAPAPPVAAGRRIEQIFFEIYGSLCAGRADADQRLVSRQTTALPGHCRQGAAVCRAPHKIFSAGHCENGSIPYNHLPRPASRWNATQFWNAVSANIYRLSDRYVDRLYMRIAVFHNVLEFFHLFVSIQNRKLLDKFAVSLRARRLGELFGKIV